MWCVCLLVTQGTAEMSDAAINVAMVPDKYQVQGETHYSHRGIVEAATFLVSPLRACCGDGSIASARLVIGFRGAW